MGLNLKSGDILFFDTAPFIYFFENNPKFSKQLMDFFDTIYNEDVQITTSIITYIEIITYPAKKGDLKLASKYRDYFTNSDNISLYPVNILIAEEAINLRAKYNLKTPDALQLATAIICGADYIISNDKEWRKISTVPVVLVNEII